jgi:hypothetical protein
MVGTFYLRARTAKDGPAINYAHPYKSVDEALRGAEKTLAAAGDIVWIVDEAGSLVLPADQVRMRLQGRNASLRRA